MPARGRRSVHLWPCDDFFSAHFLIQKECRAWGLHGAILICHFNLPLFRLAADLNRIVIALVQLVNVTVLHTTTRFTMITTILSVVSMTVVIIVITVTSPVVLNLILAFYISVSQMKNMIICAAQKSCMLTFRKQLYASFAQ